MKVIYYLLFTISMAYSCCVMANTPAITPGCYYTYDGSFVSQTMNIGVIYVQRDTPVGTVLATKSALGSNGYGNIYVCDHHWERAFKASVFSVPSGYGDNVFDTNVPGVGVRLKDATRNRYLDYQLDDNDSGMSIGDTTLQVEVVKTAALITGSGDLTNGKLAVYSNFSSGEPFLEFTLSGENKVIPLKCAITTPELTFAFGSLSAGEFGTSIGFTPANTVTQNLGLDCDPDANINVMLNATQNTDVADTSVLALNNAGAAGTATGVGVQLLYDGVPLKINENIVLKQSAGGQELLPITARYYQTQTQVMPGDASTSATLTLTYQ